MATANKQTGKKAASNASKVLTSHSTSKTSKRAAASALTQTGSKTETTTAKAAKAASKVLRDGRFSKASKSAAGSALSQTAKSKVTSMKAKAPTKRSQR